MIYLIGMSHGLSAIKAFDPSFSAMDMEDFEEGRLNARPLPRSFEALRGTGKRPLLGDVTAFLIARQRGWGEVVKVVQNPADGKPMMGVHRGFHELLAQIPKQPGTIVLSMLFGNEHSMISIVEDDRPHDFVLPGRPDLVPLPGRQIVPWPAVRRKVQYALGPMARVMYCLRETLPDARLVHCAPPPPLGSTEQILAATPHFLSDKLATLGVTPAPIRLKYYLAQLDELADLTGEHRITLLGPPPAALTAEGLLRPELGRGATHANAAYGELVLDQLEHWIEGDFA